MAFAARGVAGRLVTTGLATTGLPATRPFDFLAGGVAHAHGEGDAVTRDVDFHDFDLDHVAGLDRFVWVFDELLRQRRNVHQTVLVHADVDESTEVGHVGYHAFEHHAQFEVVEGFYALLKLCGLELWARVAAGFFQLAQDIADGHQAEFFIGELFRVEALEEGRVADQ